MLNTLRGGILIACLLSSGFIAPQAFAEDLKFETPVGTILIDIDPRWNSTEPPTDGVTGIAYEFGSGGKSMNFLLVTLDALEGRTLDLATVREFAQEIRKSETTDGKTATEIRDYSGTRTTGVYFQATGAPGAQPKAGEYRWMIAGLVVTKSAPLMFTIAWNEDGKAAADGAFAAVKGLRFVDR